MSDATGNWRKADLAAAPVRVLVFALALVPMLGGCGIKSSPERPPGSTYPVQYPAKDETPLPKPAKEDAPTTKTAPGGFPYEYPNRPPSSR